MIPINFFTFQKNPNSTKQPSGAGVEFQIALIEPTSIVTPNIALKHDNPTKFNYAYIPEFGRFYFVNDWTFSGGRWVASLNCDVLASWKEYIGASSQYVVRSAAASDGNLIDTLYPAKSTPAISYTAGENPFNLFNGRYVVGIVNGDSGGQGVVNYYVFSDTQFRSFATAMLGSSTWLTEGIEEISEDLTKAIVNPFQYVASCMWFPFTDFAGGSATVKFGWWNSGISANRLSEKYHVFSTDIALPEHPQISRGSFLNGAPFTKRFLQWAAFGKIPLDSLALSGISSVRVSTTVDAISGEGIVVVSAATGETGNTILEMGRAQIGVPVTIGQMTQKLSVGGAVTAVGGALASFVGAADSIGFLQSIGNALSAQSQEMRVSGSNGGAAGVVADYPKIVHEFYLIADEDNEHRGRPLMKKRTLSSLPGYNVCTEAELEAPCTANELEMIKGYLNGGYYYE